MLSSNYICSTPSEETKVTMPSLDSDPSVYSCESYTGPQEFKQSMKLDDLDVLKLIGAGGSGKVYLVKHKITGGLYALKVIPKVRRSHRLPQEIQRILDEQAIQEAISKTTGTFLLSLVASWNDECNFYIMTEYIRGGDLAFEVLRCKHFDASRTRFYAAELVLALENLHKLNIVHRDVKPGNIFLDATGHIVLADYGFSKKFETSSGGFAADLGSVNFQVEPGCNEGAFLIPQTIVSAAKTNEVVGTPYAMSPEQHYGCEYSYDADIWGLGITIYRMLTGRIPFARDAKNINEMAHGIAFEPIVFFDDENIDPITDDFIHGLLAKNAQDRLTIPQIKAHEYFKDINWFEVAAKSYPVPWTPHVSPTPKFPKDKSALMAGAAYLPSEDPHPEFNFVAGHIDFTTPATPDDKPLPVANKSTTFLGNIFGRLFTGPGKPLPATEEPASIVSKAANCESGPPTTAAKRKAALKPLVLPKIAARRSLELQTRRQSSSIGSLTSTTTGPYSPLSPGPPSTTGSSPRDSLFAISRATSPTTVSSLSPACALDSLALWTLKRMEARRTTRFPSS
ncbi:kinase-like domain-containing protein [Infundibulicybe gibba]|nr:kinase-like domain-containing protein [Infundibulicybe gibba]